jgi:hypothetical protein
MMSPGYRQCDDHQSTRLQGSLRLKTEVLWKYKPVPGDDLCVYFVTSSILLAVVAPVWLPFALTIIDVVSLVGRYYHFWDFEVQILTMSRNNLRNLSYLTPCHDFRCVLLYVRLVSVLIGRKLDPTTSNSCSTMLWPPVMT